MKRVTLRRDPQHEAGTFGKVSTGSFECYSLERPAAGDHPCIPAGTYRVEWVDHPEHGKCYEVLKVPKRTGILIHPANWSDQLRGCISLGAAIMEIERPGGGKMRGVSSSRETVARFEADLIKCAFELVIS